MKKQNIILIAVIIVIVLLFYFKLSPGIDGFKVNNVLLKSIIKQGELSVTNLKITSLKPEQNFELTIKNLDDLVSLSESNFKLGVNEEKNLDVTFRDRNLEYGPGIYVGALIIKTDFEEEEIPLILEIQTKNILFATSLEVSPEYKDLKKGEKASVGIKIANLGGVGTEMVEMTYFVKDLNGENILSEKQNIASTESSITRTLNLENANVGNYVFGVVMKSSDNSVSTSSYLFSISRKGLFASEANSYVNTFSIVIIIFLCAIIILVLYMIHERNKLFLQLRRQQGAELRDYKCKIQEQKKASLSRAKSGIQKKKILKKFKLIGHNTIKKIKKKHNIQRRIFKRLRKQKKKSQMQKKLEEWRKQGFNLGSLGNTGKRNIKNTLKDFKKQGYDVGVLSGK